MASRLKDDTMVNKNNETEDLLVFGYSCKLFRDDEKALYIDQGKHLIPWMGDDTLKIDRYDARGTLFDLKEVEAPSGGFDRFFGLTDKEKQVESMCDEERYWALIKNEEEESMYQEEELKRLHYAIGDNGNSYGQVEYKYEGESNMVNDNADKTQVDKGDDGGEDEPFIPSPQLDLPLNTVFPETVKDNAIIEKTAMFISNQGPQMEILLKMKQSGNPQFNFLSFDNPLHSYYRHLVMAIKSGRYKPQLEKSNEKSDLENEDDDHYLHPSLASSVSKVELAPSIPSINYKPSAHCAYSMLVSKIKDKKLNDQGSHLSKLKEALDELKEGKKGEENGESYYHARNQYLSPHTIVTPPKDMQRIIDKMASHVAKNGRDFETIVQMRKDPRFDFLNPTHVYNAYYQYKIKQCENSDASSKTDSKNKCENSNLKFREEQHSRGKLAPVCFSIKKPKDMEPVIEKSALPVEESSDEEEKEEKKEKDGSEEKERNEKDEIITIDLAAIEEKEEKNKKILAAERLKDKLTAAAREKVAMATKEKQLQMDRKRRAVAFLRAINSDSGGEKGLLVYGPQLPDEADRHGEGGSDIASLPDEVVEDRNDQGKNTENARHKSEKHAGEKHEKRHRGSNSYVRHKHREKRRVNFEKEEKTFSEDQRAKDVNERISQSTASSEEDDRRAVYSSKGNKSEQNQWKIKSDRSRGLSKDDKRHKRKKHKKDDLLDRSSRKHSKLKKPKRSRREEDSRSIRSKRSRRDSTTSSDEQNC